MTQNEQVLEHMKMLGSITQYVATEVYGITRLASRISDLKRKGYIIGSKYITVPTRYGNGFTKVKEYKLLGEINGAES